MGDEIRLWQIAGADELTEIASTRLDLESRLQQWLAHDISILDRGLMVIGREVETDFGGFIDILCIDQAGDIVVVELKRDRTPREVTAQALDYASWIVSLSNDRITAIGDAYLDAGLESGFRDRFGLDLPETVNGDHRILVVGAEVDASSERIIKYLSDTHGVNINAATFQYFAQPNGPELLARVFLIEPSEVELKTRTKGGSKRHPNLTYDELRAQAAEAGVEELYDYGVATFGQVLRRSTTRSSIRFEGSFDGRRGVVLSFVPAESSAAEGLRFQLYRNRYAELAKVSTVQIETLVPDSHEYWSYGVDSGPDYEGFQGFIASRDEIDRLTRPLKAPGEVESSAC